MSLSVGATVAYQAFMGTVANIGEHIIKSTAPIKCTGPDEFMKTIGLVAFKILQGISAATILQLFISTSYAPIFRTLSSLASGIMVLTPFVHGIIDNDFTAMVDKFSSAVAKVINTAALTSAIFHISGLFIDGLLTAISVSALSLLNLKPGRVRMHVIGWHLGCDKLSSYDQKAGQIFPPISCPIWQYKIFDIQKILIL